MTENSAFENETSYATSFSSHPLPEVISNASDQIDDSASDFSVDSNGIPKPFAGMPKEVLLHYSRQKKFVWARNILTAIVILVILALLSMVIALIAVSPACQQFWQTSPIYQIYPKSFFDSDNDGFGDLNGITAKIEELQTLGVSTIWLNPIYASPQADNGYDVSNYYEIDPIYGMTTEEFRTFVTNLHGEGIKIIMDFVPNHTSNESEWFIASSDPSHEQHEKYKDYYIWADAVNGTHPTNWQSVFAENEVISAWEWNEAREQYYYHAFKKEQPDLNFRKAEVLEELKDVLRFWFNLGVDGFRVDAVKYLYESEELLDNEVINNNLPPTYDNLYANYTENFDEIHDVIADWRKLFNSFSTEPGVYRFMETEVYDTVDVVMRYYGTEKVKEADFPMNFELINLENENDWTATNIEATIMEWMEKMPKNRWPNWVIGNHDNPRVVSRLGTKKARLGAVLTMTLSGTPGMYYGEEIGMTDGGVESDYRDPARSPMQWDSTANAGFCNSTCDPWLPVNSNYDTINFKDQSTSDSTTTMFALYKKLIEMRSRLIFSRGFLCVLSPVENVFAYVRELTGAGESTIVVMNFGSLPEAIDFKSIYSNLPKSGKLQIKASDVQESDEEIFFNDLRIDAEEAMFIRFNPTNLFSNTEFSDRCFISSRVCVNVLGLLEVC